MILSKRERFIVLALAAVVGLLLLDWLIIEPLNDRRLELQGLISDQRVELYNAERAISARPRNLSLWNTVSPELASDYSTAEQRVKRAVSNWATDARLDLPLLKSDTKDEKITLQSAKGEQKTEVFHKVSFHANGTGSMRAITAFLFNMSAQRNNLPLRITELTISPKKEGTDDLSMTITFSTIYYVTEEKNAPVVALAREN